MMYSENTTWKSLLFMVFLTIDSLLCFAPVESQKYYTQPVVNYPRGYFRNPLDIPMQLAANFGELRTNHFHMGLDLRTKQRENLPVYAAAEGYISKVKIEKGGFGRAIYINHPNGFTTLYAHLNDFYSPLHNFVIGKQYDDKKWEQEITFSPNQFPVTKGAFIAYSGNTGGSAGPHLHFEIRDTKTGNNLNPWLFDFNLPDKIPPVVYKLFYYDRQYSTYEKDPLPISIKGGSGNYTSVNPIVTIESPVISFGISAEDRTTPSSFNFGIYEATLIIDDTIKSSFRLNDISYDETRYMNACIDYKNRLSGRSYIQHLCRLPGNQISVFNKGDNGTYHISDNNIHRAVIRVKDAQGNISTLALNFRFDPAKQKPYYSNSSASVFPPNIENVYGSEDIVVAFSTNAFYDTVHFVHTQNKAEEPNAITPVHHLQNYTVPVHDNYTVRIFNPSDINATLKDKVVMQLKSHKKTILKKGVWKNNWMESNFREFGDYVLLLDTLPPLITPYGWANGSYLGNRKSFSLLIKDNLKEIKTVNAYVDGKWILCSKKENLITHTFDYRIEPGNHKLKVVATDEAGNETEQNFSFSN